MAPDMLLRLNGSKTIARPQCRELVAQVYQDPESNRLFRGNPSLTDSELWNAEARYEWYFDRDQRFTLAAFYKSIDNPIEAYTSISDSSVNTSYANAHKATLYGAEEELQTYVPLADMAEEHFWQIRRLVLIGNYPYTQSRITDVHADTTVTHGVPPDPHNH